MKKELKRWSPLIFWLLVIFGLSSVPRLTPEDVDLPAGLDKFAHYIEYTVLALLFYRGLTYGDKKVKWHMSMVVLAVGACTAGLDEFYQSHIPGRDASAIDLVADVLGVVSGLSVALLRHIGIYRKGVSG